MHFLYSQIRTLFQASENEYPSFFKLPLFTDKNQPCITSIFFLSITSQLFLNDNYQFSPYDKPVTKIHLQIYKNRCRHL